jgi:hypothetical protein
MYGQVARAIYPAVTKVTTFREETLSEDAAVKDLTSGNYLLENYAQGETAEERKEIMDDYLQSYNLMIESPWFMPEFDLAKIYMVYLTIHPHVDGNGTMARTLVDYYSIRTGRHRIDWTRMGDHSNAFGAFLAGDTMPMHRCCQLSL